MPLTVRDSINSNQLYAVFSDLCNAYVIKDFLSTTETKIAINTFSYLSDFVKVPTPRGFIAPCSFAQFSQAGMDLFSSTTNVFNAYDLRGLEWLEKKLLDFFNDLKGDLNLEPLPIQTPSEIIHCPLFSFREIRADEAGMHIHSHNQLHELNPAFAEHAAVTIDLTNDVSYFILLQAPEQGGDLVLYDAPWQPGQRNSSNDFIVQPDGSLLDVNNPAFVQKQTITLEPGDMVVFESGKTWHQVTAVKGELPRITLGGFFSKSKSGETVYYYT